MKQLNFLFALLISSAALAGGQDGSGGNVCLTNTLQLVSLEEVQYPMDSISQELSKPILSSTYADLMQTRAGRLALKSIRAYGEQHPELSSELMTLFARFMEVKVREHVIAGAREADTTGIHHKCLPGTTQAVLFTSKDGNISVNRTAWNQMRVGSQHVLLVHETLRLLQVLTPMGERLDNASLQKLTVAIVEGKPMSNALYKIFE